MLPYFNGFRLTGHTLISPSTRLLLLTCLIPVLLFCKRLGKVTLGESQPKEDYEKPIYLSVIFLGGADPLEVSFRAPGALHQARQMAKVICGQKLFLFHQQFTLTSEEKNIAKEVGAHFRAFLCIFVRRVDFRVAHKASLAREAPLNDMQLLETLIQTEQLRKLP